MYHLFHLGIPAFARDENGATLVEYGIAILLAIAIGGGVLAALAAAIGGSINSATAVM